ncbi:hypothetical protein M758_5G064100 [Ceratodon purpureus]|nr:hypothetical protein M758_5G064100 [Ceratodon purpureus]
MCIPHLHIHEHFLANCPVDIVGEATRVSLLNSLAPPQQRCALAPKEVSELPWLQVVEVGKTFTSPWKRQPKQVIPSKQSTKNVQFLPPSPLLTPPFQQDSVRIGKRRRGCWG